MSDLGLIFLLIVLIVGVWSISKQCRRIADGIITANKLKAASLTHAQAEIFTKHG